MRDPLDKRRSGHKFSGDLPVAGGRGRFYHAPACAGIVRGAPERPREAPDKAREETPQIMLQTLRKSVGSFVIKILFGLLVLSFAVWGIGDTFLFSRAGNTVAEVGDREISVRELDSAFRSEMERLRRFNIDEQQARQLGLLDQILERLISATVFDEAAQKMGLVVGEQAIQQRIRSQFGQDVTPQQLETILRNNGLSEGQFVSQLRTEIKRTDYLGTLTDGTEAPQILVDRLYRWRGEKRSASILTVPVDPASPVPTPTDAQIDEYYKAHAADFTAPEFRALTYVFLDPKAVAKTLQIPDEKLREGYEARLPQLSVPEKRTVQQMLLSDRAAADKAVERLRKGDDFIAVAKEVAGQDESATRLGTVAMSDLPAEIADAVFRLAPDAVSDPVDGPFGLQIVKVTAVQPGRTPSFEEVRAELAEETAREQAIDTILAMTNKLEESLGTGASLADAARELSLTLQKIPAVDSEGQTPDEKPVADIPAAPFLKVAFETKQGQDSLLIETDDNGFFVLRVDSVQPPALKPLETVRAMVVEDWTSDQRWQTARQKAEKIVERLNNGAKIADIAKELDLDLRESGAFTRQGEGAPVNMPSSLIADLFAGAVGRAALADGVGGVNVAQLAAVAPAKPGGDKQAVDSLKRSVGFGIANDIAAQLVDALKDRYGVSVNQSAIRENFFRNAGES
jgi:peptidyl-prolyl cis-trans isomerase D